MLSVNERRVKQKKNIIKVMGGKCQCCGYNKYYGALELHHLNPAQKSFSFSNKTYRAWASLENELKKCILLCANCHREVEAGLITIEQKTSFNQQIYNEINNEINNIKEKTINKCPLCGSQIWPGAKLCKDCSNKNKRTVNRPSREELKKLIRTVPFTKIGQMFNVSDNAIRKWCITYNLPNKSHIIKQYSDEEWKEI